MTDETAGIVTRLNIGHRTGSNIELETQSLAQDQHHHKNNKTNNTTKT